MKNSNSPSLLRLLIAVPCCAALPLIGQVQWSGSGADDFFSTPGNWVGNAVPGSSDEAAFDGVGLTVVDFDRDESTSKLLLTDTGGVVTFNLFTDNSPSPADYHTYTLGSLDSDALLIGDQDGDAATLRLAGFGALPVTGSTLAVDGGTTVGNAAGSSGTIEITNNSRFNSSGLLYLGNSGYGEMRITSGEVNVNLRMAENSGSTSLLTVSGPDSVFNSTSFFFLGAVNGSGAIIVEDGGEMKKSVDSGANNIAQGAGSEATMVIRGDGSEVDYGTVYIRIGDYGAGTLIIEEGGLFTQTGAGTTTANVLAGRGSNSSGEVLVTGADSRWQMGTNTPLVVGNSGQGHLIVADSGVVAGGRTVTVTHNGQISGNSTVEVSSAGYGVVSLGGLVAPGLPNWSHSNPLGDIEVDLSSAIGTLVFDAEFYTQEVTADGVATLQIKIGTGVADRLSVLGDINLIDLGGVDPVLELLAFDSPEIGFGDTFQILEWTGTLTGEFDIQAFALDGDLEWDFSDLYSSGQISVIPEPAAILWVAGLLAVFVVYRRRVNRRAR